MIQGNSGDFSRKDMYPYPIYELADSMETFKKPKEKIDVDVSPGKPKMPATESYDTFDPDEIDREDLLPALANEHNISKMENRYNNKNQDDSSYMNNRGGGYNNLSAFHDRDDDSADSSMFLDDNGITREHDESFKATKEVQKKDVVTPPQI